MGKDVSFPRPQRGHEILIYRIKVNIIEDFKGSLCQNCGRATTIDSGHISA